jgi:hypothetical protein
MKQQQQVHLRLKRAGELLTLLGKGLLEWIENLKWLLLALTGTPMLVVVAVVQQQEAALV